MIVVKMVEQNELLVFIQNLIITHKIEKENERKSNGRKKNQKHFYHQYRERERAFL